MPYTDRSKFRGQKYFERFDGLSWSRIYSRDLHVRARHVIDFEEMGGDFEDDFCRWIPKAQHF
jgi:hypothetical protein